MLWTSLTVKDMKTRSGGQFFGPWGYTSRVWGLWCCTYNVASRLMWLSSRMLWSQEIWGRGTDFPFQEVMRPNSVVKAFLFHTVSNLVIFQPIARRPYLTDRNLYGPVQITDGKNSQLTGLRKFQMRSLINSVTPFYCVIWYGISVHRFNAS